MRKSIITASSKFYHSLQFGSILLQHPYLFLKEKKYLFVVSHMRSYSTLLCHILGSNQDITGHSEMFYSYHGWDNLLRLKYKAYIDNNKSLSGTYVLDKLLYNSLSISSKVFKKNDVYTILMIRNPEHTIKSIINLKVKFQTEDSFNISEIVEYYMERLEGISRFVQSYQQDASMIFFDSDNIIDNTDYLLENLSNWLNLVTPLCSEYNLFDNTGTIGKGDPSNFIKSGSIQKTRPSDKSNEIEIPASLLQSANDAYSKCKEICLSSDFVDSIL